MRLLADGDPTADAAAVRPGAAPLAAEPDLPVVAEVVRGGVVESRHRGSVVALDRDGVLWLRRGHPEAAVFPRSSLKPLQAVGLLRAGARLSTEALALACASHSGEPEHIAAVRRSLAAGRVSPADLRCPAVLPSGAAAAAHVLRSGGGPDPVQHNCSGKHAGMLAACVANGWPTSSYLDPDHPLQRVIGSTVADLAGEQVAAVAVDGCGAPVFAISLVGLALAFGRLVAAADGTVEGAVAAAVRGNPHLIGGTGRDVTRFLRAVPGLVAKDGAEGVYAAALAGGPSIALKVDDGAARGRGPILASVLVAAGVLDLPAVDVAELLALVKAPVYGGGRTVGEIRAVGLGSPN